MPPERWELTTADGIVSGAGRSPSYASDFLQSGKPITDAVIMIVGRTRDPR